MFEMLTKTTKKQVDKIIDFFGKFNIFFWLDKYR